MEISKWVFLSYMVSDQLSAYRNGERIATEKVSAIARGDVSNHTVVKTSLHFGTHLDFPCHFLKGGKNSADYDADYFTCDKVAVVITDQLANPHLLSICDIEPHLDTTSEDIQCVLVKTSMGSHRMEDCYWNDNIGVDQGVAEWLRSRFPHLRFLGFDFMSVSGTHYRELGRQVHRELFSSDILPIEDMDLHLLHDGNSVDRFVVSPYRVNGADAAPVTVFAKIVSNNKK